MYKVEKGIKIPDRKRCKYPFTQMAVGDTFLVPEFGHKVQIRVLSSANNYERKVQIGFKLSSRTVENGIRFWRIR